MEERQSFKRMGARLLGDLINHGARGAFAREVGLTPQAFSYILNPEDPRAPRLRTVWALVARLLRRGVPPAVVREVAFNLIMADPKRIAFFPTWDEAQLENEAKLEALSPRELVEEVESALHPPHGWEGWRNYPLWLRRILRLADTLAALVDRLSPRDPWSPLLQAARAAVWAQAAGLANCIHWLDKALEWGRRARSLAEGLLKEGTLSDPWLKGCLQDRLSTVGRWVLSAAYADCGAFYNIGRPRLAWDALRTGVLRDPGTFHLDALALWREEFQAGQLVGELAYRSAADGLSLREVIDLFAEGDRLLERGHLTNPDGFSIGLRRYAAWALLRGREVPSRHRRQARQWLEPTLNALDRLDPLGQVMVRRAWAELRWQEGEIEEAKAHIRIAARAARDTGLWNQLVKIERDWVPRGRLSFSISGGPRDRLFPRVRSRFFNFRPRGEAAG